MAFSKDFNFPTEEELTVQEVNLSLSALRAGAIYLGKYCEKENDEFMLCKSELQDPRKCLNEGKLVTQCTLNFFRSIKKHCCKEFNQYSNCLFKSSSEMEFKHCRNTQAAFEKCVLEKMNFEKPPFGWQAEVHIHHTDRPKPPEPEIAHFPDAAQSLPYDKTVFHDPKHGVRGRAVP